MNNICNEFSLLSFKMLSLKCFESDIEEFNSYFQCMLEEL